MRGLLTIFLTVLLLLTPLRASALDTEREYDVTINPTLTFSTTSDMISFDAVCPIWGTKKNGGLSIVIQSNNTYQLSVCAEPLSSDIETISLERLTVKEAGMSNYTRLSNKPIPFVRNKPNTGGAVYGIDFWIEGCIDKRFHYHCKLFFTASQL